ncbi:MULTISPECIES: GPW/gp25 family protein [Spirosoma]|uniref:GPW/gp25 family protein n=1 Tax=Spirosoma liriopis TaxID=2937440 RepID=A0ABT0HLZ7_9BACT|nr:MULTISPECIES: GPW/gp25 family protein [Spirosoma]MCK8493204.1 GPW/gp25 family protein [Spirosoma liriopis]UHG92600.1 GPW/gp25 family protein [Spirosoma oryzicola]
MANAYSLHAPISNLLHKRTQPRITVVEAIREHINLLLATRLGEYRYDPDMGCSIWNEDYANITNPTQWKSDAEQTITNLILQYEKRLQYARVYVDIDEPADQDTDGRIIRVRRRITIRVTGNLPETGETMPEQTFVMYFSPLASE